MHYENAFDDSDIAISKAWGFMFLQIFDVKL